MSPIRRKQANQPSRRNPFPKQPRNSKQETRAASLKALPASIDDDLGSALSLALAIELMGFGLGSLGDDYSKALIAVTHLLIGHLNAAKAACRSMWSEELPALGSPHDSTQP